MRKDGTRCRSTSVNIPVSNRLIKERDPVVVSLSYMRTSLLLTAFVMVKTLLAAVTKVTAVARSDRIDSEEIFIVFGFE